MRVWLCSNVYVGTSVRDMHYIIDYIIIACLHSPSSWVCSCRVSFICWILNIAPFGLFITIIIGLICFKVDLILLVKIRCILFKIFKTLNYIYWLLRITCYHLLHYCLLRCFRFGIIIYTFLLYWWLRWSSFLFLTV